MADGGWHGQKGEGLGCTRQCPAIAVNSIAPTTRHGTFVWASKHEEDTGKAVETPVGPCGTGRRAGYHRSAASYCRAPDLARDIRGPPASTATTAASSTAASSTTTSGTSSSTTIQTCAQRATETFIFIDSVAATTGGGFTLTVNAARLVCGGPDDFHWNTAATNVNATVLPGASIEVLGSPGSTQSAPIASDRFAAYMATDHNSRIFLVTGPLSMISALQEQFHP